VIYLSGPMSGVPEYNFPAFHAATKLLRKRGCSVISPAELDEVGELSGIELGSQSWEWYLSRDLREMLRCDTVAVLPGWRKSRGARLEVYVARRLGMKVVSAGTLKRVRTMREFLRDCVAIVGVTILMGLDTVSGAWRRSRGTNGKG